MGDGMPSQRVNRRVREAELSPPSSVEFKNEWSYTPFSTLTFMSQKKDSYIVYLHSLTCVWILSFAVVPRHKTANLVHLFGCSKFPGSWSTQKTFNSFARTRHHWPLSWTK